MTRIKTISMVAIFCLSLCISLTAHALSRTNRGAGVPSKALPKELKGLNIHDQFVPGTFKEVGTIHALRGHVVVIHRATREAYFGKAGDTIYENDSINTLADTRCRLRFYNEDLVTMASNTVFGVEEYRDNKKEHKKTSLFSMLKGKAMFYAMRLLKYKQTRFRLKTPTAVMGVRGTKFGANVYWVKDNKKAENEKFDIRPMRVADSGSGFDMYLAANAPGGGGMVCQGIFHCEDGSLNIKVGDTWYDVPAGEWFRTDTGKVALTPDAYTKLFNKELGIVSEGEKPGENLNAGTYVEQADLSLVIQDQNAPRGEGGEETLFAGPVTRGYFASMLTKQGSAYLHDVYITSTKDNRFRADSIIDDDYLLWNSGYDQVTTDGTGTTLKDVGITTRTTVEGILSYCHYGYWETKGEDPDTFPGSTYDFWNKAWWIEGEHTLSDNMPTTGNVAYSGVAHGTYWNSSEGVRLDGDFNCKVDFGAATINHFNLSVNGGSHSASIANANGDFASSHFVIDSNSGTWLLDGSSPCHKAAYGSLWGPNGEEIGGVWGMYDGSSSGAAGIFAGSQH